MDIGLSGKRILVTGASTGIGAGAARAFAGVGAAVAVHYNRSEGEAEGVVAEALSRGAMAFAVQGDLARAGEAARVVEEAARLLGGLDVLVNNAGTLGRRATVAEADDALIDEILDLNVKAVVAAIRAALPHLKESRGTIINTSSQGARNGGAPGAGLYAGSKAFVSNYTRAMAKELAPFGIRVNAVAPGLVLTPFQERFSTPERIEELRKTIPLGRVGTPQDCAGAFLFLASETMSGYITGHVLEVNGGRFMA